MKNLFNKKYLISLSCLSSIAFMSVFYNLLNTDGGHAKVLLSPLDEILPVIPFMSIPYLGWYPYIFLAMALLCLKDRSIYFKILVSMNISLILCYIIYYNFQTTVIRPVIFVTNWTEQLLQTIYHNDPPFNCFPSIHCLHSYLVMRGAWLSKNISNRTKFTFTFVSFTIILSTLFIKQHVIYDVISAILLGEVVFCFIYGIGLVKEKKQHQLRQHLRL
jgi:hypothetical protein